MASPNLGSNSVQNCIRTMVKKDLRMWQQVKDGCCCGGHPPFTHRTRLRLGTNNRCINLAPQSGRHAL